VLNQIVYPNENANRPENAGRVNPNQPMEPDSCGFQPMLALDCRHRIQPAAAGLWMEILPPDPPPISPPVHYLVRNSPKAKGALLESSVV
jgi:hypothetical protein